jgi:hypothetical protein
MGNIKNIFWLTLLFANVCFGTFGDVILDVNGAKAIWYNNDQFFSISGSPSMSESTNYVFPPADGSPGQFIFTNGSGVWDWATPSGTGAPNDVEYYVRTLSPFLTAEVVLAVTTPITLDVEGTGFLGLAIDGVNDLHIDWGAGTAQVNASDVPIALGVGSPTIDQIQEYFDNTGSSGYFTGGELTDGGSGTVDVAAGEGFIRTSANDNAPLLSFKWSASAGVAVADNTTQYVFVDDTGTINLSTDEFAETVDNIMLGVVTDEAGAISHAFNLGVRLEESIGQMGRYTRHVDDVVRNRRKGGLIFGESGDVNRYVTITAGQLEWGRTSYPIPTFNTSGADTFDTYSAGGQEATGVSAWPNTQYDNAGTLTTMTNNRWAVLWWYIEPDGHIVMLYGRDQYVTEGQAEDEEQPSSSIPNRLSSASVIASKFIFQKSEDTTAKIETAFGTPFTGSGVTDHGNLAGLTDDDHTQYSLADGTRDFTGDVAINANLFVSSDLQFDMDGDIAWYTGASGTGTKSAEIAYDAGASDVFTINPDVVDSLGTVDFVGALLKTTGDIQCDELLSVTDNDHRIRMDALADNILIYPGDGVTDRYLVAESTDNTDASPVFRPSHNASGTLGVTGTRWKDLYLSGNLSDGTNALTIADANTAYTHSQVTGNDGIHGTNYIKDNEDDTMAGILTVNGVNVGDSEYIAIGVPGNETGALGSDGRIYSDGSDLIVQIESPTGASADFTNPELAFSYFDFSPPGGLYFPLISSPRGTLPDIWGLSHTIYAYDAAEAVGGAFRVAEPGNAQAYGAFLYELNPTGPNSIVFGSTAGLDFRMSSGGELLLMAPDDVNVGSDTFFSNDARFFPPQVDDDAMDATNGTEGEMVFNLDDNTFYGCTVTGTPATWAAFH